MKKFTGALALGAVAGVLDVLPMLAQGIGPYETVSAFLHWTGLGLLVAYVRLPLAPWLSGLVVALLTGIPIAVLVAGSDLAGAAVILISSVLLGSGLGFAANRYLIEPQRGLR